MERGEIMKVFQFDVDFIQNNIDGLITLEDYVPLDFKDYGKQAERDAFLKPKHLLILLQKMHKLILEKCKYSDDQVYAWNSVLVEWLDYHPEFEGIIAADSIVDYQNMKNSAQSMTFVDLLYVEIPSENIEYDDINDYDFDNYSVKDDSHIRLPDFNKKQEYYDKYPSTLIAPYLAYLV